jgi:hypothetical protein
MTTTQFAPVQNPSGPPFQFTATLTGPTSNVSVTGSLFSIVLTWNVFGQRWYFTIYDQSNNVVLSKPLIASPPGYPINLVGGYFSGSTLVYLEATQQFVVTP